MYVDTQLSGFSLKKATKKLGASVKKVSKKATSGVMKTVGGLLAPKAGAAPAAEETSAESPISPPVVTTSASKMPAWLIPALVAGGVFVGVKFLRRKKG